MVSGIAHLGSTPETSMTSLAILGLGLVGIAVVTYDAYRQYWA
jgi:hypothetical protein